MLKLGKNFKVSAMKKITTISSLIILGLGTLGFLVKAWVTPEEIHLDLTDEDIHLYL